MAASDVDFILVETRQQLREALPLLDEGASAVAARLSSGQACGGDVFAAALSGQCEVRLIRADMDIVGFVVTAVSVNLIGGRTLFAWMVYVVPGSPDVIGHVDEELVFVAREQGCEAVEFATTRPAWERRLGKLGYSPEQIMFRKEVL